MTTEELLSIRNMMREELQATELRIRQDVHQDMKALLDLEVNKKLELLAEGHEAIFEKLPAPEDAEILDTRITALEAMVKKLNRDVTQLKKAN